MNLKSTIYRFTLKPVLVTAVILSTLPIATVLTLGFLNYRALAAIRKQGIINSLKYLFTVQR